MHCSLLLQLENYIIHTSKYFVVKTLLFHLLRLKNDFNWDKINHLENEANKQAFLCFAQNLIDSFFSVNLIDETTLNYTKCVCV